MSRQTVLVVVPNWLGDAVMALPAIADVRRAMPDARLIVAARGGVADLCAMVPGVDAVLALRWKGSLLAQRDLAHDVEAIGQERPETALLLPNSFASAWLIRRAGVRERWGYASDIRTRLLTRAVPRPTGSRHQGAYYQHLVAQLGFANGPLTPQLVVPKADLEDARRLAREAGWDGNTPFVVLAPGAAYGTAKQWIPAHVTRLVIRLVGEGTPCVFVGSTADAGTIAGIRGALSTGVVQQTVDLSGRTSLRQLTATLALARACVSNDSGAMHVAAALGTPVVAPFGPTREHETHPLTAPGGWARVVTSPTWCRPCMLRECPLNHACMTGITPEMVGAALGEIPSRAMTPQATPEAQA